MLDELQLTYTSYNGQNLNSPAVSVIRGSTVVKMGALERHRIRQRKMTFVLRDGEFDWIIAYNNAQTNYLYVCG
jgi:hypothetical protein